MTYPYSIEYNEDRERMLKLEMNLVVASDEKIVSMDAQFSTEFDEEGLSEAYKLDE